MRSAPPPVPRLFDPIPLGLERLAGPDGWRVVLRAGWSMGAAGAAPRAVAFPASLSTSSLVW